MPHKLPTDAQMELWREQGALLCECVVPARWPIQVWGSVECRRCGKLICPGGADLLARRAELVKGREPAGAHVRVGTFADGSQVLIEDWGDTVTAAVRPSHYEVWSAPATLRDET